MTATADHLSSIEEFVLVIASAAAQREREAIVALVNATHTDVVGGPALLDRIIAAIEKRGAA